MTDDDRLAELFRHGGLRPGRATRRFRPRGRACRRPGGSPRAAGPPWSAAAVAVFALVGVGAVVILPAETPTASTAAAPAAPDRAGRAESGPDAAAAPNAAARPGRREGAGSARPHPRAVPAPGTPPAGARSVPAPEPAPTGRTRSCGPTWSRCCPRWSVPRPRPTPTSAGPGASATSPSRCRTGAARGLFAVSYLPPGTAVDPTAGSVSAPTASGGTVVVHTVPVGGTVAPFQSRLPEVAASLAPQL